MANRLIHEQSPYLLQHAHNPVDWYPWGNEPFERAKNENKPVLVSIGYAACHWCHVMEGESFENEAVAAYMNEHFICIKVDREEHPDVDHLYMDAVQAISGSGGWPLNAFVTPDRLPFYGGTYFPPVQAYGRMSWLQILQKIHEIWTNQYDEIAMQSNQMLQHLKQASLIGTASEGKKWDMDTCRSIATTMLAQADKEFGGFGRAPKFPGTMTISYLLEHYHFTKHEESLQQALLSLDAMINGGIYDQAGGGFARYATDDKWLIPHFEKMLYDNALLVLSLCDAYKLTKNARYKAIVEETIAFAERELKASSGGYYSALDADSEGVEGKFYTWTWEEWADLFGEKDEVLMSYFGVSEEGNWEHTNILHEAKSMALVAQETGLTEAKVAERIQAAKHVIFEKRAGRVRPLTDDKSLLSWNALMNLALTKAADTFTDDNYKVRAAEHMQWMLGNFHADGQLMHVWKQGRARITANLDDYAYLVQAMLQLASLTGDNDLILKADDLTSIVMKNFLHESGNFFYYTSVLQTDIPVRKVDMYDGATPSANAVMAHNMLLLGIVMERTSLLEAAYDMLLRMSGTVMRYANSFAYWAQLLQRYAAGLKVVVIAGDDAIAASRQMKEHYFPQAYPLIVEKEMCEVPVLCNKFLTTGLSIFVCTEQACLPPTTNTDKALQLINS